jgi:hypothetical protein
MGASNLIRKGKSYRPARARICKRLKSPGIDSKESIAGLLKGFSNSDSVESIPGLLKRVQIRVQAT